MRYETKRGMAVAMVLVAGCACSLAMAQQGGRDAAGREIRGRQAKPQRYERVEFITPQAVYVNGQPVPFTLGGPDANEVTYDNFPAAGFFVVPIPNTQTLPQASLDDLNLNLSGPQRITGARLSFGTQATVTQPTTGMGVRLRWFNAMNPASSPVNSSPSMDWLITFAAPTGGWVPNTAYVTANFVFISEGPVVSSNGGLEILLQNSAGTAPNPDFTPVYAEGPSLGTSGPNIWIDQNGNNIYESGEAVAATSPGNLPLNLRIALESERVSTVPTGRCCLAGGACIIVTSAQCTGLGGTYGGNGTTCPGPCPTSPILWHNGPLATGTVNMAGSTAPPGTQWSEIPEEGGTCTLSVAGFSANAAGPFRLADNFVVPAGQTWNVSSVTVYAYQSGGSTTTNPLTALTLRIVSGNDPSTGTTVWGDQTTNVLPTATSSFANIYRMFNRTTGTTRPVWQFQVPVSVTLQPGMYWIDFGYSGTSVFTPSVSPMVSTGFATGFGVRDIEGADGRQFIGTLSPARWVHAGSSGLAVSGSGASGCLATTNEHPFIVRGTAVTGPSCYPNCDGSTTVPFLNVADFTCFLSRFAAGDPYANCDGSTTPPVLNVADFTCFLSAFAAGCSAP